MKYIIYIFFNDDSLKDKENGDSLGIRSRVHIITFILQKRKRKNGRMTFGSF